jgi:tetratricopeptide (TPR) repeat protein
MKIRTAALAATALLCAGIGIGYAATKNAPALYRGKSSEEAALALVEQAKIQADNGSWERIAVGRVLYLGGRKTEGRAIFDAILADKHADSDEFRIARVYAEAHEWAKAKPLFDQYIEKNPKDDSGLANAGAYYLLNGDRATAESLFDRSFERKGDIWNTVAAAGAYLGVPPQE